MIRLVLFNLLVPGLIAAATLGDRLAEARGAFRRGEVGEAVSLANQAVKDHPSAAGAWFFRGQLRVALRDHDRAVTDFDQCLKLDRQHIFGWQERGAAHFRLGRFKLAIRDWDEVIRLDPSREPHHWQRGIAYYYAGEFEKGRRQFTLHQTVNTADVENAVFHFICNARGHGMDRARKELIPISGDTRVPMAEIHRLYAGELTATEVLAAASRGDEQTRRRNEFYAHYYLGLYFEATGDRDRTWEHVMAAEKRADVAGYMGDCARVHAGLLRVRGR